MRLGYQFILIFGMAFLAPGITCLAIPISSNLDSSLVGVWEESGRVDLNGNTTLPVDPLLIGFFSDGEFRAVFASHRFETYHDFWGEWEASEGTLRLVITGGDQLPDLTQYDGKYRIDNQELQLEGISIVENSDGQTLLFSYQGPVPKDRIIP